MVAISLAIFFFLYSLVLNVIHPCARNRQSDFYKISDETVNKTLPIGVITLRSLAYPANLAAGYQLYDGTNIEAFHFGWRPTYSVENSLNY